MWEGITTRLRGGDDNGNSITRNDVRKGRKNNNMRSRRLKCNYIRSKQTSVCETKTVRIDKNKINLCYAYKIHIGI